jgi:hypothetical protein
MEKVCAIGKLKTLTKQINFAGSKRRFFKQGKSSI